MQRYGHRYRTICSRLAQRLSELGGEVLVIDRDESVAALYALTSVKLLP